MALKQHTNAADVDLAAVPSDVYGIIAKILLRAAAETESGENVTSTVPVTEGRRVELW